MTETSHPAIRVAIVGTGNVGATTAYTLLMSGLASEIVLVDANRAKAEGEEMDLNHAVPFTRPTRVWTGEFSDCSHATITVIAAGAAQQPGETRLDLVKNNAEIFSEIVPRIVRFNPSGIILIATNPVDVLTYATWKLSKLPSNQVIGSGTILDTARFRQLLSERFAVDARSVHAHIIGEHGDSEVPVWSLANIAGMRLPQYCETSSIQFTRLEMDEIFHRTRDAAYHIIQRKGATYYAVAAGIMRIIEAILRNQRTVLSVSSLIEDYYGINDVCLSLPTIISRGGVERFLRLELDKTEIEALKRSADVLRTTIQQIGF